MILDSHIKQSRRVREQVIAFSKNKAMGNIDKTWTEMLDNLLFLRDSLGYSSDEIDIYPIFI